MSADVARKPGNMASLRDENLNLKYLCLMDYQFEEFHLLELYFKTTQSDKDLIDAIEGEVVEKIAK